MTRFLEVRILKELRKTRSHGANDSSTTHLYLGDILIEKIVFVKQKDEKNRVFGERQRKLLIWLGGDMTP
jgi:hypothetical protein